MAFATIDPVTFQVRPSGIDSASLYQKVTALKSRDLNLRVYISLGGWTFNDPGPTRTTFSDIANSVPNQAIFIRSLISFMATYNFDGVDIDWEYPGATDRGGRTTDFDAFPKFMATLKESLRSTGGRDGLTMAIPASYWYLQHFDIKTLSLHVDWFNIMSYDLHGAWDMPNKWTGPYLNAHTNLTEIRDALNLLWRNDINPDQVNLGLAFYGRTYTVNPDCVQKGCVYKSAGRQGACSGEAGILLNSEIFEIISKNNLTPVFDKEAAVKIVYWEDQWVSYDDDETLKIKADFARENCLGGVMVWALTHDNAQSDALQDLSFAVGRKFTRPGEFAELSPMQPPEGRDTEDNVTTIHIPQCRWTGCGETCDLSFESPVARTGPGDDFKSGVDLMMDNNACPTTQHSRTFCCPSKPGHPECGWYDHGGNGKCEARGCPTGFTEVGSNGNDCRHGRHQTACCKIADSSGADNTVRNSLQIYAKSFWQGDGWEGACDPPGESHSCPTGYDPVVLSSSGSGGVQCRKSQSTWFGREYEERQYCTTPDTSLLAWGYCNTVKNLGTPPPANVDAKSFCLSDCPKGSIRAALLPGNRNKWLQCSNGGAAFCCNAVAKTETVAKGFTSQFNASLSSFIGGFCDAYLQTRDLPSTTGCGSLAAENIKSWIRYFFSIGWSTNTTDASVVEKLQTWQSYVPTMWPSLTLQNLAKLASCYASSMYDSLTKDMIDDPGLIDILLNDDSSSQSYCQPLPPDSSCTDDMDEADCEGWAAEGGLLQKRSAKRLYSFANFETILRGRNAGRRVSPLTLLRLSYPSSGAIPRTSSLFNRVFRLTHPRSAVHPGMQMVDVNTIRTPNVAFPPPLDTTVQYSSRSTQPAVPPSFSFISMYDS